MGCDAALAERRDVCAPLLSITYIWPALFEASSYWNHHRRRLGTCVVLARGLMQFFCDDVLNKCREGTR
jgi:hypothetical protein